MIQSNEDYRYLLGALSSGGCDVDNPQSRVSLLKLGYMVPATIRDRWANGNILPFGMALTKKGQKRAQEISDQIAADRLQRIRNIDRRGRRGAAWPKSYKGVK